MTFSKDLQIHLLNRKYLHRPNEMFTKRPMADISIKRKIWRLTHPTTATLAAVTSLGNEQNGLTLRQN